MSIKAALKHLAYRAITAVCPHFHIHRIFHYDKCRYLKHAGSLHQDKRGQRESHLAMTYHVLEKGLTMPERRLGFGSDAVIRLIALLQEYRELYGDCFPCFEHGIAVLKAYAQLHEEENFELKGTLKNKLEQILSQYPDIPADKQIKISKNQYFSYNTAPFPLFSLSRHSVRHLCGQVSEERIRRAVALATHAPSACNRQHARVHCISDKEMQKQILDMQNGSRGFGTRGDKLLIITANLHCLRWVEERNDLYTNAGIFVMNLCYALHYEKVAHCILNCSVPPKIDRKLREITCIPEEENVVCYILCGDCPDEFMIASSPKKRAEEILTFH